MESTHKGTQTKRLRHTIKSNHMRYMHNLVHNLHKKRVSLIDRTDGIKTFSLRFGIKNFFSIKLVYFEKRNRSGFPESETEKFRSGSGLLWNDLNLT